jgi:hypothetical protein
MRLGTCSTIPASRLAPVTGERILASHQAPQVDTYFVPHPGQDMVCLGVGRGRRNGGNVPLERRGGGCAAVLLRDCHVRLAVVPPLKWVAGGDFVITALLAVPLVSTFATHWFARPHVLAWLLVGSMIYFEKATEQFRRRDLVALTALGAAWANIHASFFIAIGVAVMYASGHAWKGFVWKTDPQRRNGRPRGICWRPAWHLHEHAIRFLADPFSRLGVPE